MIALLVMTDGRRDCIERTIASADENLHGPIGTRLIHDDSGDLAYTGWLRQTFPDWRVVATPQRSGFGGAIRSAWSTLRRGDDAFVFHLEDDFTFNRPVDLSAMASVLLTRPYLVQLVLRRQPWNDEERAAGGIVEQHPDDYDEQSSRIGTWLEHRRFFSTNPSLYRRSLIDAHDWPQGAESEGHFTHRLLSDPDLRFAFWGAREDDPWVTHIGRERVGTGY